jgi:acetyl esterase/lipase
VSDVVVEKELVIGKGGGRKLKVDVFRPAVQSGPVPGVLFMPGKGWRNCDRAALAERYGYAIAKYGYVCVNGSTGSWTKLSGQLRFTTSKRQFVG